MNGDGDYGFFSMLIKTAREKPASAHVGDGMNRWTAVHRLDAARLFRLTLENASAGTRFHGVAEESIAFKSIAQAIGKHLGIPVVSIASKKAVEHFT